MKYLLLGLFMTSAQVFGQSQFGDLLGIQQKVGEGEVDSYLKKPGMKGLSGAFFTPLLPSHDPFSNQLCSDEPAAENKSHYEIVLIAETNIQDTKLEILPRQYVEFSTGSLKYMTSIVPASSGKLGLTQNAVLTLAENYFKSISGGMFDVQSRMGRELFIEGLVQSAAHSNLSEKDLSQQMASIIKDTYESDEDRFHVLSSLSTRLYRIYNTARNPGFNNSTYNPTNETLPAGDMTLDQILKGSAEFNEFAGGVCNDISEAVAMVGEHLFPDKDVLVVNSGTHFGVVVSDGKTNHIINGGQELTMKNRLLLKPDLSTTNLRINKVVDGNLREIAVVDTQTGQAMEAAFQTGRKLLKTDADISTLLAEFKKGTFTAAGGAAKLADSNLILVVAKFDKQGDKWRSYVGAGLSGQVFDNPDIKSKYQVHFRAGLERSIFKYVNTNAEIKFTSGARIEGMYGLSQNNSSEGANVVEMSAGLNLNQKLEANFGRQNPAGLQIRSSLQLEHSLGPSSWGATTGILSRVEGRDVGPLLSNVTFHLNQVNATVTGEKKLSANTTGFSTVNYQGSNIGQNANILAGLNIKAPSGAQILIFSGYNQSMGGYMTQKSLLVNQTGPTVGGKYITNGGIELSAQGRMISGQPAVSGSVKIPLGGKRKKRPSSSSP